MTINSNSLKKAFFISQSYIDFTYDRLTDNPQSLQKSFVVSSSATDFYIRAIPTTVPADNNIKFFLKKGTNLVEVNQQRPLILIPRDSVSSVAIPGEIVAKVINADLLFEKINSQDTDETVATISYEIKFNLTAGVPGTPLDDDENTETPKITSFNLAEPSKPAGCNPVYMFASWTVNTDQVNISQYSLRIKETGVEFPCRNATRVPVYTKTTYADGSRVQVQASLTLELIRNVDSEIMDTVSNRPSPILTGFECTPSE